MNFKTLPIFTLVIMTLSGCNYTYHKTSSAETVTAPTNPITEATTRQAESKESPEKSAPRKIIIYRVH